jgi:AcrR family transcriptional regulator
MPREVDHDARREELADALWRLVLRDGIEAASVRRVAAEAGWSSGALRHYFTTQSELLSFAMELVARRADARIAALPPGADARSRARTVLEELLPLDAERRAEMQVWLAFTMRAVVDPRLRPLRDRTHAHLRDLCREVVDEIGTADPQLEAERLHALVDGLALHAVVAPRDMPAARQVAVLAAHLASLH